MKRDHSRASEALTPRWILVKGALFAGMAVGASALLILENPRWTTVFLLVVALWATARAYYFAFYVIEHWVDREFRYSGLLDFALWMFRRRRPGDAPPPEAGSGDA